MSYRDWGETRTTRRRAGKRGCRNRLGVVLGAALGMVLMCVLCGACGTLSLAALGAVYTETAVGGSMSDVRIGRPAPDAYFVTLDGTRVRLSDYRGTPVLLNFWAIWCAPCVAEMPALSEAARRHDGELVVLAVNKSEPRDTVAEFVAKREIEFTVLLDAEEGSERVYSVRSIPTAVLIDADGVVREIRSGAMSAHDIDRLYQGLQQPLGAAPSHAGATTEQMDTSARKRTASATATPATLRAPAATKTDRAPVNTRPKRSPVTAEPFRRYVAPPIGP